MATSKEAPGGRALFAAMAAISAGFLFAHVWLNVDPRLIYHRQGPLFFTGWGFLGEHLGRPGGLVEYAAALLAQFHWLGWPGAAVMAALALAIALAGRAMLGRFGARWTWPALVPVALLAVLANRYDHPLATWVGLGVVLSITTVYVWFAPRRTAARVALFMALAALAYYVAAGATMVFALVAAVGELAADDARRVGRPAAPGVLTPGVLAPGVLAHSVSARVGLALAYLAWAAAVAYAAAWLFDMPLREAYTRGLGFMFPRDGVALAAAIGLYAIPVLAAAWAALRPPREPAPPKRPWLRRTAGAIEALAFLAAGVALALGSLDPAEQSYLRIDWCTQEGRWPDVLAEARASRGPGSAPHPHVVRALFHSGRLLADLFSYPLSREEAAPPAPLAEFSRFAAYARGAELMLEIGRVGEAEHAAYEALETLGERPEILRRLVLIHVLKGQPEAARPALGLLEKTLWHADWARQCRLALQTDPQLAGDDQVRRVRGLMSSTDLVGNSSTEAALVDLLRTNPRNRMALEYLMAQYLVAGRSDRVVENLARLRQGGMTELPRHVQEAVVQFAWVRRDRPIPLHGFRLAPEIRDGYPRFAARLQPHAKDPAGAWHALADDYGHTYWFYYTFGCTPFGRQGPPAAKEAAK